MIEVLNKAPLGFRRILFVKDVPDGFGAYTPRGNNVFAPDEPLIIYSEPIGVAWKQDGDEYASKLVVDFDGDVSALGENAKAFVSNVLTAADLYEPTVDAWTFSANGKQIVGEGAMAVDVFNRLVTLLSPAMDLQQHDSQATGSEPAQPTGAAQAPANAAAVASTDAARAHRAFPAPA